MGGPPPRMERVTPTEGTVFGTAGEGAVSSTPQRGQGPSTPASERSTPRLTPHEEHLKRSKGSGDESDILFLVAKCDSVGQVANHSAP